ncbi:hypothetical protein Clacol_009761 [Clathrus columnatus]|uniref:Uncharacterized protein n=1 Tax=Clathrus columnatus TaxID=1419009 RepID=A0AAV5APP9_9AGAM|nr:hypothetical protein Clacol_009761 [Clathrus columnatus]
MSTTILPSTKGPDKDAVIGIVFGVASFVLIILVGAFFALRRHFKRKYTKDVAGMKQLRGSYITDRNNNPSPCPSTLVEHNQTDLSSTSRTEEALQSNNPFISHGQGI